LNNEECLTKLSIEVHALAHEFAIDASQAFLMWVGQRVLELEHDDAFALPGEREGTIKA